MAAYDQKVNKFKTSTPTPITVFAGQDNHCLKHIPEPILNLCESVERYGTDTIHYRHKETFSFALSRMMIKSDGCPKNKITGIKGGGHRLRYGTNKQCAEYVAVVPVQHNDFCIVGIKMKEISWQYLHK